MTRLVYGYDPLCGWCYGFIPAMRAVASAFPELEIELRLGGLVTGARIRPYSELADYIRGASKRMEAVRGVALGEAFHTNILAHSSIAASSLPPSAAILRVRDACGSRAALAFAASVQTAHFRDGRDLNDGAVYRELAAASGWGLQFDRSDPYEARPDLEREFAETRAAGISSFPTLILMGSQRHVLPTEYAPSAIVEQIRDVLAQPM